MFLCCNERLSYTAVGAVLIMVFNLKLKSLLPVVFVYINYVYCLTLIPERKRSFFNLQTNLLFFAHLASSYPWKIYHSWFRNQAYKNTELFSLQRFPCKGFVCTRGQALEPAGEKKKKDAYPILFLQWILFRASGNLEKDGATDRTMREEEKNILGKDLSLLTLYTCPFRSKIASDSLYNQQYASILRLF